MPNSQASLSFLGEGQKKRHVIPVSYLNQPSFQEFVSLAEEEFGYDHLMGAIRIVKSS
ncbi:hypothetical protein C1H46_029116 [Malus baccata]|uniref:Auxin-responsive protein n=1 Tax=Malus baccata TaxID=106549 RepID=A0A540LG72_MALBA|nr:hypothetical protein C1H46_029116 [Malus baccata]